MMTPERLAGIDARREAATPGDWEAVDANEGTEYGPMWMVINDAFRNPPDDDDVPWLALELHTGIKADAEFIAHAPRDITDLRAEVDRLRARLADVQAAYGHNPKCNSQPLHTGSCSVPEGGDS